MIGDNFSPKNKSMILPSLKDKPKIFIKYH